jgi:hypothetical protein
MYPIHEDGGHGTFFSSSYNSFLLLFQFHKSYKGHAPCNATTPTGMAVAYPQSIRNSGTGLCLGCHNLTSDKWHTVYIICWTRQIGCRTASVATKVFATVVEKNIPWSTTTATASGNVIPSQEDTFIVDAMQSWMPSDTRWCREFKLDPSCSSKAYDVYCTSIVPRPLGTSYRFYLSRVLAATRNLKVECELLSPIYLCFLPVQRVVMRPEPFRSVLSKLILLAPN